MSTRSKNLACVVLVLILLGVSTAAAWACTPPGVGTPGYWKNHPEAWPVEEIRIGGITYARADAIALMQTPGKGDKTYTLFRATVAALLNKRAGNDTSCPITDRPSWTIQDVISKASWWLGEYPPGDGVKGNSDAWQDKGEWLYEWLDAYNNGLLCAPSRDQLE